MIDSEKYEWGVPKKGGLQVTYSQDWSAYNQAQTQEKMLFMHLLDELACFAENGEKKPTGRPSLDRHDMIFSMCLAAYCGKSSRRSSSELEIAERLHMVDHKPHFNSLLNYFRKGKLTPMLHKLITLSSLPLKQVEEDFAVDASGFSTSEFGRWFDHKWGRKVDKQRKWVKAHVMSGVKTNVITSIEITTGHVADVTQFESLVRRTGKHFAMKEISADKGYVSRKNFAVAAEFGAMPFIPFKKNAIRRAKNCYIWSQMYDLFQSQWYFKKHYHKRSNAETVFSMMKKKFSSRVRTKNLTSQTNELLCMAICHNICVLIQEMFELGIDVDFGFCANELSAQL